MTHHPLPGIRSGPCGFWRSDRGALALELSMIVPLAFLLLFSLVQGGIWFHGRSVAHHTAQQALDAQRVYGAPDGAGVAAGREFLAGMGGSLNDAQIHVNAGADTVSVQVEGNVIMLVLGWRVHVSQSVQAPVEKFRP
ncbi:pilus assembly protein (plasmid) [Streptomyces sp. NBC_00053]|uniref:TadE/TadG family type IV pilus assembly protein n=1 Tax=unclassified Streptomyces TaxID=2593676 RepID=UPI00224D8E55|nr:MULTISPECIES: TadE/TadG family type IV pilus assembly protein [unclassified Streptomyces]MCX4399958.1 pilus assembly protein [Streptomyces sp. NBC_01767]MCX5506038.1 pilus assembly protein [Streptomyces sp. NBC_00052]MCX5554307.1 pilus assembly protein [Streptomyces sp. NBC_00051]WSP52941.1 pilus assembly protein [Streptomyces sp. NBC_01243]